jgi:hypothetical protein
MQKILILGAVIIVILSIVFFVVEPKSAAGPGENSTGTEEQNTEDTQDALPTSSDDAVTSDPTPTNTGRIAQPAPSAPVGKLKAANFTGTLQKVDTGCFADGECYMEVDGKHITTLRGWSQDTVGQVLGVEGFGDLEAHIGAKVEVYAQDLSDGTYTLYGSEGFYIKLVSKVSTAPKAGSCVVGGCSGQLCVDSSQGDVVSTCEWRDSYACYQGATCERQQNGQCGWTATPTLTQCLAGTM